MADTDNQATATAETTPVSETNPEPTTPTTDTPAPPKPEPKATAIQFPANYKGLDNHRLLTLETEAKKILGFTTRSYLRNQGTYSWITADCRDSLNFPTWHAKAGRPRYTWVDRGDGVKLGTLVEDAAEAIGSTPEE